MGVDRIVDHLAAARYLAAQIAFRPRFLSGQLSRQKLRPRRRPLSLAVEEEIDVSRCRRIIGIAVAPDGAKIVFLMIEYGLHVIV